MAGEQQSTFGHWRQPSSPGLGALGLLGTVVLFLGLIAVVIALEVSKVAAVVIAVLLVATLVPLVVRVNGRSGAQRAFVRLAWWSGRRRRMHSYRSGLTSPVAGGRHRLPGLAAQSEVFACVDAYERPFGMVHVPAQGHCSVTFRADADGAALVDSSQVELWVAGWGQFLAALGHEPGLVACTVTVETAPDPGVRLAQAVAGQVVAGAPELARRVLAEIVDTYPAGSAVISTRIQVTYRMSSPAGRRSVAEMAVELGTRLPGLAGLLAGTGAGAVAAMTVGELAETVRVAYDPAAAVQVELSHADPRAAAPPAPSAGSTLPTTPPAAPGAVEAVTWADAGPVAAEEGWDSYRHDSGVSTVWAWSEAPRGTVSSRVLLPLLRPHSDIARKRVSLVFRPHEAGQAAAIVERDVRTARFKAGQRSAGPLAREDVDYRAAVQSAAEEARGAGLTRLSVVVVATVTDPGRLRQARAVVEGSLAPAARLGLRRAFGAQAATFTATLPVGVVLADHVRVPAVLREALS